MTKRSFRLDDQGRREPVQPLVWGVLNPLPEWAVLRAAKGLCALIDGQCVTHGVPDTAAHHFAQPGTFND
jgi:hypothetical protein